VWLTVERWNNWARRTLHSFLFNLKEEQSTSIQLLSIMLHSRWRFTGRVCTRSTWLNYGTNIHILMMISFVRLPWHMHCFHRIKHGQNMLIIEPTCWTYTASSYNCGIKTQYRWDFFTCVRVIVLRWWQLHVHMRRFYTWVHMIRRFYTWLNIMCVAHVTRILWREASSSTLRTHTNSNLFNSSFTWRLNTQRQCDIRNMWVMHGGIYFVMLLPWFLCKQR